MLELAVFWVVLLSVSGVLLSLIWRSTVVTTTVEWGGQLIRYQTTPSGCRLFVDGVLRSDGGLRALDPSENPATVIALTTTVDGRPLVVYRDGNITLNGGSLNGRGPTAEPLPTEDNGEDWRQRMAELRELIDAPQLIDELEAQLGDYIAQQAQVGRAKDTIEALRQGNPELCGLLDRVATLLPRPEEGETLAKVEAVLEVVELGRQHHRSTRGRAVE